MASIRRRIGGNMENRYLFKSKTAKIVDEYNNDVEDGVWVQGSLRCDVGKYTIFQFETERADYVEYEIDPSTICQCTGLKDKNGTLIWENDIVKKHFYSIYDSCVNSEEYIGIVKLKDCAWVVDSFRGEYKCAVPIFEAMTYSEDVKYFEIIGNVFDNPELIER